MTIDIQHQPGCAATLSATLPPEAVNAERGRVVASLASQVRIPGYRPGKAPARVIETKFKEDIEAELVRRLLNLVLRTAQKEHGLNILGFGNVMPDLEPDMTFRCKLNLTLEPEVTLPEYLGIPVTVESAQITQEEIDRFIEMLRERDATFDDIEGRPAQFEDFAVTDSEGFQGDRPLSEVFPNLPKNVASHKGLWIRLQPDVFLPGFAEQIVGMSVGTAKEFDLNIPADFVLRDLAGEKLTYKVTLVGLKNRKLPELDDSFAQRISQKQSMSEMRQGIAEMLHLEKVELQKREIGRQIEEYLLANSKFEVPASYVRSETRTIVDSIVRENTARGISEDVLKENSGQIVTNAAEAAEKRVRLSFLLLHIARKEGLEVSGAEYDTRLAQIAMREGRDFRSLRKELEKRGAAETLRERFLEDKTLAFLISKASVSEKVTASDEPATSEASAQA